MPSPCNAFVLLAHGLLLAALPAQKGDAPVSTDKPSKVEKVAEWPTLADTDKDRVRALIGQFRKPDAALHDPAKKALADLGAGAVPILLLETSDRADNLNRPIFEVLDRLIGPQHAALVAREVKKPRLELRRYLTIRMCRFADPELLPVLQATMKDKDESTAFHAALGALALRDKGALAPVMTYSKSHWQEVQAILAEVLPAARSLDTGNWVFEAIGKAPVPDQANGLRLARYLATKDQAGSVRPYLDATDHTVKKEAVNTMRVLHDEAPIENMPVFQVIEMAKAWAKKV